MKTTKAVSDSDAILQKEQSNEHHKFLLLVIGLTLVVSFLVACGGGPQATQASPTPEPEATATPIPSTPTLVQVSPTPTSITATSTPVPPSKPTPALGVIKGKLIGGTTGQPISEARVVLCSAIEGEEKKCNLRTDMMSTSHPDGSFSLANIPAGTYVVIYAIGEDVDPTSWEGIIVNYGPFSLDTPHDPFGGDRGSRTEKGFRSTALISGDDIMIDPQQGPLTSIAFGLTLEFVDGKPVTVQVEGGKTTEVEILMTGQ